MTFEDFLMPKRNRVAGGTSSTKVGRQTNGPTNPIDNNTTLTRPAQTSSIDNSKYKDNDVEHLASQLAQLSEMHVHDDEVRAVGS